MPLPQLGTPTVETFGNAIKINARGQLAIALAPSGAPIISYPDDGDDTLKAGVLWNERWYHKEVDTNGIMPRVLLDGAGDVHMLYARTTENQFRYAKWTSRGWHRHTPEREIRSSNEPTNHAMALDPQGNLVLAWRDAREQVLRVGTWNGRGFDVEDVESGTGVGRSVKLAVGSDGTIHLAYAGTTGLRHAVKTGATWMFEDVAAAPESIGLALDSNQQPVIGAIINTVRIFRMAGGSWAEEALPSPTTGASNLTLRLDGSNRVHLSFLCNTDACGDAEQTLHYRRHTGTAWEDVAVIQEGLESNFVLDAAGAPHFIVAQATGSFSPANLRYIHFGTVGPSFDSVSELVTASAGGMLQSADGLFTLDVPAGALASDAMLSVQRVPRAEWSTDITTLDPALPVYRLLPDGTMFSTAATARTQWPMEAVFALSSEQGVPLMRGALVDANGTDVPAGQKVSARTDSNAAVTEVPVAHFSDVVQTDTGIRGGMYAGNRFYRREDVRIESFFTFEVNADLAVASITMSTAGGEAEFDILDQLEAGLPSPRATVNAGECEDPGIVELYTAVSILMDGVQHELELTRDAECVEPPDVLNAPEMQDLLDVADRLLAMPTREEVASLVTRAFGGAPVRPAQHPEHGAYDFGSGDASQLRTVWDTVLEMSPEVAMQLFGDMGTYACGMDADGNAVCPGGRNQSMVPGGYVIAAATLEGDFPTMDHDSDYQVTFAFSDGGDVWQPPMNAPFDPYAGTSVWVGASYDHDTMTTSHVGLRVTNDGTTSSTIPLEMPTRVIIKGNTVVAAIPEDALTPLMGGEISYRAIVFRHTGNNGALPGGDFNISVWPALDEPPKALSSAELESVELQFPSSIVELITADDGSEAPGGETIFQELWGLVNYTASAGTIGLMPPAGGVFPGVDFELETGSDPGCITQWNGTEWLDVETVGPEGFARFRADPNAPAGGCSVGIKPVCTGTPGITCPPTMDPPIITTVQVRHGSIDQFFIQVPGRICEDGEPTELHLGRWKSSLSTPVGQAADLYVCARTSFGAYLRYDVLTDDNPDINWTGPADPDGSGPLNPRLNPGGFPRNRFIPIDGTPEGGGHGFIRINYQTESAPEVPADNDVMAAGRMHMDTLTIRKIGSVASGDGVIESLSVSAAPLASVDSACTGIVLSNINAQLCVLDGQRLELAAMGTVTGFPTPVHVSTDDAVTLGQPFSTRGFSISNDRARLATFSTYSGSVYMVNVRAAAPFTGSQVPESELLRVAVIRAGGPLSHPDGAVGLQGLGDSAPLRTVAATSAQSVEQSIDVSADVEIRLGGYALRGYQPGHWTQPPPGLLVPAGTRAWHQLFATPVNAPSTVRVQAQRQGFSSGSVYWTVSP